MNYPEAIQYLYNRLPVFHHVGRSAYKPGLENTIRLLNALNNPQRHYKTIHIAGTNGKGSVSHMLAAILQEAGYKTGLYTSPHLVDFRERIKINGRMILQEYVIGFIEQNKKLFEDIQPSFFEAVMAMAFAYFAEQEIDAAVVETGLGGRLDSTNIIQPELSVITNISFDHTAFLGTSLDQIAAEKAGIIKQGTPVVVGESQPAVKEVFIKKALEMNAPIMFAGEQLQVVSSAQDKGCLHIKTSDHRKFEIGLTGNYQQKNAVTALIAAEQLKAAGFSITEKNIEDGLRRVVETTALQGRWQTAGESPRIILDTGHNPAGIEWITRQLREQKYNTLRMVIGMANDKDISKILALMPKEAVYYFTQAGIARALPAGDLIQKAQNYGLKGNAFGSVEDAVKKSISDSEKDDLIFIGGSTFVVGEALAYLQA